VNSLQALFERSTFNMTDWLEPLQSAPFWQRTTTKFVISALFVGAGTLFGSLAFKNYKYKKHLLSEGKR
jgi:hypothetical protein